MKHLSSLFFEGLFILPSCSNQSERAVDKPVKIIFDSDLGPDYDDVGALAILHAMADRE